MGKIAEVKDKNRSSPQINLLSTIADGIPSLGWVVVVSETFFLSLDFMSKGFVEYLRSLIFNFMSLGTDSGTLCG